MINPVDADTRNISEGDLARVFNNLGEFIAEARVTNDVSVGTAIATFGYWGSLNQAGGAANSLTKSNELGFSGTPHYYDTGAEIAKHLPK